MNKADLLKMPTLQATRKMLRMAMEDTPDVETNRHYGETYVRRTYKHWLYIRSTVQDDVLKVSCFLPDSLRERCMTPRFEIYLDRKQRDYLTYVPSEKKWLTGCFYHLPWHVNCYGNNIVAECHTMKQIKDFFGTPYDAESILKDLREFQYAIMKERLVRRHKKETDPWDEDLKQTRELPRDWEHWVDKVGIPEQFIFYNYTKKKFKTGYCSYCEHEVQVQPHHNEVGTCPHCHHKVIFKALGKFKYHSTDNYCVYLPQKCKDGFMLREFIVHRHYNKDCFQKPRITITEQRRAIGTPEGIVTRAYYHGAYKQREYRWIATGTCSPSWSGGHLGKIYGKSLVCLDKTYLRRTGLMEMYRIQGILDPEHYLAVYERKPYIEKFAKAGLARLVNDCIGSSRYYSSSDVMKVDTTQTSLTKMLCITPTELKRLKAFNGGKEMLRWLQYEKAVGTLLPDNTMHWLIKNELAPSDIEFATRYMTVPQIHHYIERQMREGKMRLNEVINTWKDYLAMASRLGYDLNDEIVYRVRRLKHRHDQLVAILQEKDTVIRAGEIAQQFPNAEKNLRDVKAIYSYGDDVYTVVVPDKIEDVLHDGRHLHHCAAEHERYWDRMERNESYVFFLRKTDSIDTPYYTLEVEPGGTIRQKRTFYDNQNEDIEEASDFLRKWQAEIRTRLRDEDRKLAEQSKILRIQNFEELRRENVRINTGKLQGQKLVDVLMADLMVAA